MVDRVGLAAPALALVFNAFVWGVSWWPFRQLQALGVHPLWSTALTYVVSLACLLAVRPQAWRGLVQFPAVWLLALASGLTNVGFNWSVTIGDVVRVVLLFYLMPAWSVLLAWPLLGEKPTARALLRLLLALAGVLTVLHGGELGWPVPRSLPDWLALMGGFCFALTNILLRRLAQVPAEMRICAMFTGGAGLATLTALAGAGGSLAALATPSLTLVALAAVLSLAFLSGNVALQYGASRLPAHATALIMLSEVVFASVSSVALGAAELTPRILLGAALILGAAAWAAVGDRTNGGDSAQ